VSCGFRNYLKKNYSVMPEEMMLDKAQLLELTAPEMTVLVGGMRSLGVSSDERGLWGGDNKLDSTWFSTLLDMNVAWTATGKKRCFHWSCSYRNIGCIFHILASF
jgi:catalase-peroxidase